MRHTAESERRLEQRANDIRRLLLEAAGISETEQARGLRAAWKRVTRQLHSRKLEIVSDRDGNYKRVAVPDNSSQLRAAEAVFNLTGANANKQSDAHGDVIINIQFPAVCQPTMTVVESPSVQTAEIPQPLLSIENHAEHKVR